MRSAPMLGITAMLLLGGCDLYPEPDTGGQEAVPVREKDRQFQDIPVPRSFTYDRNSFAFQHGRFRVCNLIYTGTLDVGSTTEFMNRQMALAGWKLLERSLENGRTVLNFSKDTPYAKNGERCAVTIEHGPSERKTLLTVSIKPPEEEPLPAPAAPRTTEP